MSNSLPLSGVKVLDLTIYVAGPAASTVLGFMGADVIKVEPLKGDPYRLSGAGYGMPVEAKRNPLYDACNGYKRDIAVDFRSEEGKEVLKRIAKDADIIVTNYRNKALNGMGMDYETVKSYNPKVVYGYFSGYGDVGPDCEKPGFDATSFFSRSGFAMRGSYLGNPPMASISAAGDTISSCTLAAGVLGAYANARVTGVGQKVSCSLLGSALWVMGVGLAQAQYGYIGPFPVGPGFIALSADYECKDGVWVRICGMSGERYWEPICKALDMMEYAEDPRFCTSKGQHDYKMDCYELLKQGFKKFDYEEIVDRLSAVDFPYEVNLTTDKLIYDEQSLLNHYITKIGYENGEEAFMSVPPFAFSDVEPKEDKYRRSTYLGENTVEVLKEYGFSQTEIDSMLEAGHAKQII